MPPDPVLALLCFIGLIVYVCLGGFVSAIFIHHVGNPENIKQYAGIPQDYWKSPDDIGPAYFFGTVFWPALAVFGMLYGLLVIPVLCGRKVTKYVAAAQLKELQNAT